MGYFVLAYALSWSIGIPLALLGRANQQPVPFAIHYLIAYGPMLAALIMTGLIEGKPGVQALLGRLVDWRVKPAWWLVAVSPLLLFAVLALGLALLSQPVDLGLLGQVNFLPNLGIGALLLWILTFGVGEEMGWRGYALPRLQRTHSALKANLILAPLWALWHLPQFFYLFELSMLPGWLLGLLAGAIVFTWLYNSARGSILIVAVWHGAFNFITASQAGEGIIAAVLNTIVMIWAILVVILYRSTNLSPVSRQIRSS